MCLVILKDSEKKTALEDMVVYKVLTKSYTPPFYGSSIVYKLNVLHETEIADEEDDECTFDSEARQWVEKVSSNGHMYNGEFRFLGQGFHSARTKERLSVASIQYESIVEFTIPKGSEYYEDGTGLLISNKIIRTGD